jgi:hypothetical protein
VAGLSRSHERSRRIGCCDAFASDPRDELARERAGPAANVDDPLAGSDAGEVRERSRQAARVAAHEPVIRIGRDVEAHVSNLPPRAMAAVAVP